MNKIIAILLLMLALIFTVACQNGEENESTAAIDTTVWEIPTETDETTLPVEVTTTEQTTEELTTEAVTVFEEVTTAEETTEEETTLADTRLNYDDMKCLWLSQFDLQPVYCNGSKQTDEAKFTEYMEKILDNTVEMGINTVIVQMRPNADSMYPSEAYPPSAYVVGAYGNDFDYDPVDIITTLAHERELSVQAWINPMRAMTDANIKLVSDDYLIKQWYNNKETKGKYIVQSGNYWYLNPAYEEVRDLIIAGAREIVTTYDVDGLHMDDYFYPTTDASFDSAAYSDYKKDGGELSLADYRRECLSLLVKGLYDVTKAADPNLIYGISPAGNWNTVYDSQYADVYLWCSEAGYIDYICPQVYFGMEHQSYDFIKTSEKWQSMIPDNSNVKLIIGMSLGKAQSGVDNYAGTGKNEWAEHKDILKRCLEYTENLPKCTGVSYFCYQYFYNSKTGESVSATQDERDNFLPILKDISWQ